MNKDVILIVAAILMVPMVGGAVKNKECEQALRSGQMRKDCINEAICLWAELEKMCEQAAVAKSVKEQ